MPLNHFVSFDDMAGSIKGYPYANATPFAIVKGCLTTPNIPRSPHGAYYR